MNENKKYDFESIKPTICGLFCGCRFSMTMERGRSTRPFVCSIMYLLHSYGWELSSSVGFKIAN